MLKLILQLLLAHILGDFVFQNGKWVKDKEQKKLRSIHLYLHILIHALALIVVLQFDFNYWPGILIIIITHFFIDLAKLYLNNKIGSRALFISDQILHLLVIAGVVYMYEPYQIDTSILYTNKSLLLLLSVLTVTFVSAIFMKIFISKWSQGLEVNGNDSLESAGMYIGILERLLVFVFVIHSNWQGIGFLVAAKSIFRFGDLTKPREKKLTEYILIGTLFSFAIATVIGLLYKYVLLEMVK